MIAIAQIAWGVKSFRKYKRLKKITASAYPSPEAEQWVEDAVKAARSASKTKDPDIITMAGFQRVADSLTMSLATSWIGYLRGNLAVFVMSVGGSDVLVLPTSQVMVKRDRKKRHNKKNPNVTLKLGKKIFQGSMSPTDISRLETWRGDAWASPEIIE